jgi:hypothetical protein
MSNCSLAMSMRREKQRPRLGMWSPLATAICSPTLPELSVALVSMKLWVESESRSARSEVEPMATETGMVRSVLGWMPVSAANEIVGSSSSSSSSSNSMENRCLHPSGWPGMNFSLRLDQRSFSRRSTISALVNFLTEDWLIEDADCEEPTALADGDVWPDGHGGLELVRPME